MSSTTTNVDVDQSAIYEQAQFYFVHREFAQAADTLMPALSTTWAPSWLLLFALCRRAFSEPDTEHWPFESNSRKGLRELVQSGNLWVKLAESYDSNNQNVPDLLITSSFQLAAKHMLDTRQVTTFVENYMATNTLANEVFASYIVEILVGTQHDFYYARELVNQCQKNIERAPLLEAIDKYERKYLDGVSQAREEERAREELRVSEAIAKSNILEEPGSQTDEVQPTRNEEPAEIIAHGSSVPARPHSGLLDFWRQWAQRFIRSQGLYNTLIVVVTLASIYVNRGARNSVRKGAKWLALALRHGISMALQVTYL